MSGLSAPQSSGREPNARWKFLRDVAVFEAKLSLNNLHNFFQVPLTLAIAVFDLLLRGKVEGGRFYKFVEIGRTIDDSIDIYSVIADRERPLNTDFTVDAVVSRLEAVIVREYEKGGTAASIKEAVDKALDGLQSRTDAQAGKAAEAVRQAASRVYDKMRSRPDIDL